MTRLST